MKRTNLLFVLAACTAPAKHPLTYADGSPAPGNLGQTGRAVPAIARTLLRMSAELRTSAIARPLLKDDERPATGNVMTKGHCCTARE